MAISWTRLPFRYTDTDDYEAKLTDLISDTFYERLPEVGFETREEQIYTAFRIAHAFAYEEVFLAEAGTGTGKTFAYLIPAVMQARRRGAPVVIAVAGGVLETQLAGAGGDVATLAGHMALDVDVRVARGWQNYVCELKVDALQLGGAPTTDVGRLLEWAGRSVRGERSEIGDLPDEVWEQAAWDASLACDTCKLRGHCRVTKARDWYHQGQDLLICTHELFFLDLWTRRERQASDLRPFLPAYSGVVFDEGHRVPFAAQLAAGGAIRRSALVRSLEESEWVSDRKGLVTAVQAGRKAAKAFWTAIAGATTASETERFFLDREAVRTEAETLEAALRQLQDEVALDEDSNRGSELGLKIALTQARLDQALVGLRMLVAPESETVVWVERPKAEGEVDVHAVPRHTGALLTRNLFSQKVPVLLTSATLAPGGSFGYMKRMLGVPEAGHSQVEAPFDYERQALVYLPEPADTLDSLTDLLTATAGRTLLLVRTEAEQVALQEALDGRELPFTFLWEGEAERSELLRRFAEDVHSVLVGTSFWEGVDVPGEALSCVAVLRLPFPPDDPLVAARHDDAAAAGLDPFAEVDVPEMALRLEQGAGRLIRTAADRGIFALLDQSWRGTPFEQDVRAAFPSGAKTTADLADVAAFLA